MEALFLIDLYRVDSSTIFIKYFSFNVNTEDPDQTLRYPVFMCVCVGGWGGEGSDLYTVCHSLFAVPLCVIGRLCSVSVGPSRRHLYFLGVYLRE